MSNQFNLHGLNYSRHPLCWLDWFLTNNGLKHYGISVNFSRYTHNPQQMYDQREFLSYSSTELSEGFLEHQLHMLNYDQELALHSRISTPGGFLHIPMIDLGTKELTLSDRLVLQKFSDFNGYDFEVFQSGRSYHLYGTKLLEHWQWHQLMGSVLLLNEPSGKRLIDTRWVGHRLIAGYGSLRLSLNTTKYKSYPNYIDKLSNLIR